jgi:phosphoadenosine phosphosulfate reductase
MMTSDQLIHSQLTKAAAELVSHVLNESHGIPALTCSFQIEDMVVLDLLRQHVPGIPVIFLETGYHFPETYIYRDLMTSRWNLNIINATAPQTVLAQESEFGILYESDPTRCCQLRKVAPLMQALEPYDVWFTGLRREQSPTRRNLQEIEQHQLPTGKNLVKVSPLAAWDTKQVWRYISDHEIEYLPLYDRGYTSIGCAPCTSIPAEGADPRSGRWGGAKLECGIHVFRESVK